MNSFLCVCLLFGVTSGSLAQNESLRSRIEQIVKTHKAVTGVAILGPDGNDSITVNNDNRYPMQSVYKFHLALAVLDQVDRGKLSLDQVIHIGRSELLPGTWSPLRDDYPAGSVDIQLRELLRYTVSKSDNNGCDILFRLVGGPLAVNGYIHAHGIEQVAITATEEEMSHDWDVQYSNWSTPLSAASSLQMFYEGKMLQETTRKFLWDIMVQTTTGPNRIKGLHPSEAVVAHKTGTSGPNEQSVSAATNDIGIVMLPDGRHFIIAVFVSDSHETHEANERIIADVARTAWDHFQTR